MVVDKSMNGVIPGVPKTTISTLLSKAEKTEFVFRKCLNLPTIYTFGNEIEFNCYFGNQIEYMVDRFNNEHSLYEDEKFGTRNEPTADGEIVTPIMTDNVFSWHLVRCMYKELRDSGATVGENTANHIHFGTHMIDTVPKLINLIKTLVVFEPIIFRFGYGYDNHPRTFIEALTGEINYSMMMSPRRVKTFIQDLENFDYEDTKGMMAAFYEFSTGKDGYRSVFNFNTFDFAKFFLKRKKDEPSRYDHMEVRCFNGTLDPRIVQNNANLILNIIRCVNIGKIDMEYVEKEYQKFIAREYRFDYNSAVLYTRSDVKAYNTVLRSFSDVDWDKAMKLADMIFNTKMDKLLFLKQYLKLFSNTNKEEVIVHL